VVAEPLHVGGPQFRAVAEAEIVDLVVAQRLSHHVHVACHRRCPDVLQERRAVPVDAALGQLPIHLFDVCHAVRAVVDHRFAAVGIELRVGLATQRRCGVADAPGIESH
jgi:hypothetical protein